MWCKSLDKARNVCKDSDVIFSEDLTVSGCKRFIVGSLDTCLDIYAKTYPRHWYEAINPDKPCRLFFDLDSSDPIPLAHILKQIGNCFKIYFQKEIVPPYILTACNSSKQSYHIVYPIVFANIFHVGAFVRRIVLYLTELYPELAKPIDCAVYTKWRQFRIKGSTKRGSVRVMRSETALRDTLIQNTGDQEQVQLSCMEIDGSEPLTTSANPSSCFAQIDDQWICLSKYSQSSYQTLSTNISDLLQDVYDHLEGLFGGVHRIRWSNTYRSFSIETRSTKCYIAQRCHKHNHVWLSLSPFKCKVWQHCHDNECVQRVLIDVPDELWDRWRNAWKTSYNECTNTIF